MKVRELREKLAKEDQDREVILQLDAEGNSYSPLSSWWTGSYKTKSTWRGEAGVEGPLLPSDKEAGYSEEDIVDGVPALILVPVN